MIYEELIKGQSVYTVTDMHGRYIAETYSKEEADQILAQYRFQLHSLDQPRSLYKGIQADPLRSK